MTNHTGPARAKPVEPNQLIRSPPQMKQLSMVCAAWRARTRRDREHEEQHEHGQRRGSERAERGQVAVAAAREAAAAAFAMIDRCDAAN